jgi:hypothetical protein
VNDRCATCDGDGVWCGKHSTPDGCDCDDDAPRIECPDCGGTGLSNEDEDEDKR